VVASPGGQNNSWRFREKSSKALDKTIPVGVVEEDAPQLDSAAYDVVQCTGCINATSMLTRPGHAFILARDDTEADQFYVQSRKAGQPIDLIIMDQVFQNRIKSLCS
jgi:hypothetical protein